MQRIISVDIETKQVTCLENGLDALNSVDCLRFTNDWICANLQGYNRRPSLIVGKLPESGNETKIEWVFTETEDYLKEKANVELLTLFPKIEDQNYRKKHLNYKQLLEMLIQFIN